MFGVLWGSWLLIFWMLILFIWSELNILSSFLSSSILQIQIFSIKAVFAVISQFCFENHKIPIHKIAVSLQFYFEHSCPEKLFDPRQVQIYLMLAYCDKIAKTEEDSMEKIRKLCLNRISSFEMWTKVTNDFSHMCSWLGPTNILNARCIFFSLNSLG